MKILTFFTILLVMCGCGSIATKPDVQYKPITQYIAVYTPPSELKNIIIPTRPDLAINHLSDVDKDKPDVVVRTSLMTINQLVKYSEDLENTLQNYQIIVNTIPKNTEQQVGK